MVLSTESFIAGSIAGAVGTLVGHPLDTLKTFAQTNQGTPPTFRALFRGMGPPLLTAGFIQSGILGIYENMRRSLWAGEPHLTPLYIDGIAGTASGVCISCLTSPIMRIKVQQQLDGKPFWQTLEKVAATRTLYSGYSMTLLFESSRGIYMIAYSVLKQSLSRELQIDARGRRHDGHQGGSLPLWARTAAGAGANVICWSIMYPVDVVRSVQMSQSTAASSKHDARGALRCARALVRDGGVARLYRGFVATMLRAGPVAGIILPCFELVLPWLEGRTTDRNRNTLLHAEVTTPSAAIGSASASTVRTLARRASGPM